MLTLADQEIQAVGRQRAGSAMKPNQALQPTRPVAEVEHRF
jgi:hypothetical protein